MKISFTIFGTPIPQGSMRAFVPKGSKFPVVVADNKGQKPWRQECSLAAIEASRQAGGEIIARGEPVAVRIVFFLQRPPSKPRRVTRPATRPDLDKLARSIFDSLKGVAYEDDGQVVDAVLSKRFGTPERAEVTVVSEAEPEALPLLENATMELFA